MDQPRERSDGRGENCEKLAAHCQPSTASLGLSSDTSRCHGLAHSHLGPTSELPDSDVAALGVTCLAVAAGC
jgi:hypothetical protein